ncbi:MAG: 3-dehydroquinate synthase, partial [Thermoanaerobaculia bacterium]
MDPHRTVPAARGAYPVFIQRGIVRDLPRLIETVCRGGRRFVVVSRRVLELHGESLRTGLGGFDLVPIEDGEEQKDLAAAERLIGTLLERGAKRDSVVVAIGGGTVGDLAGFAASVLLRGVDLVHVPTTLLAQIDSSIGGKVGVNHRTGKNLIGSIWPPRAVVIDPDFLATLAGGELESGIFEAMKGGVIADPDLFELTRRDLRTDGAALDEVIRRAIGVKAAIVAEDEREGDRRRLLNYGHTIGHGIEAALDYRGLTHGEAVAWGMIGANGIAARRGVLPEAERERIDGAIRARRPRRPDGADARAVLAAMEHDKKFTAAKRVMVLPERVGACTIVDDVTPEELALGVEAVIPSGARDQGRA